MRPVVSCTLLLLLAGTAAAGETSGRLRLQMGHEYDTNAQRICTSPLEDDTSPPPPPDGVTRLIAEGTLVYKAGQHDLLMNFLGGAKLFSNQDNEDQVAVKLEGVYALRASKNWSLGGRLTARDTTLRYHDRDYTQVRAELFQQNRLMPWISLEVFLGGKYFFFKPDKYTFYGERTFSHSGPVGGLRLHLGAGSAVRTTFFYNLGVRFFDDNAKGLDGEKTKDLEKDRLDLRHTGGVRVKHPVRYWGTRRLILELSYLLSFNDSNSAGSSALWHRLRLVVSVQLPLDITLHVMGTLQFTDYPDGIYFDKFLYEPEADENENSLVVRIGYPLWKGLSLVLQGAIYRNDFQESATDLGTFRRETIMLGLAYDYFF
jgi:hypothetical protein